MATSTITLPTKQSDINALLQFGLLVESITYPNLLMRDVIPKLVSPNSPFNLTQMLGGTVSDPEAKLAVLNALIPTLPSDVTYGRYIAGYYIVTSISVAAVWLRVYARRKYTGKVRTEDKWAVAAAIFAVLIAVLFTLCLTIGHACRHLWTVSYNDFTNWLKFLASGEMFFSICLIPVKLCFLIFYHSLSPSRTYRLLNVAVGVFVVLLTFSGMLLMFFQCQPFDVWNHLFTAKCVDQVKAFTIWGILTIISDFLILLLPISEVLKLNLKRKEKLLIVGIFSTGAIVCVASILRVITMNDVFKATDKIYIVGGVSIWSLVELNLGLICSCLPALKHLFIGHKKGDLEFRSPFSLPSFVVKSIKWGQQSPRRENKTLDTFDFGTGHTDQTGLGTKTTCTAVHETCHDMSSSDELGKKDLESNVGQKIMSTQTMINSLKDEEEGHASNVNTLGE